MTREQNLANVTRLTIAKAGNEARKMAIPPALKKRRVDDGTGTIAALASMNREVSPPPRSASAAATPVSTAPTWQWPKSLRPDGLKDIEVEDKYKEDLAGVSKNRMPAYDDDDTEDEDEPEIEDLTERSGNIPTLSRDKRDLQSNGTDPENPQDENEEDQPKARTTTTRYLPSPFQLTYIRDLPPSHNMDAVTLQDLIGHPLLTECWQFNYLHSIPFILEHFDPDTRPHINLKIVHGFWRNDDVRKQKLQEQQEAAVNSGAKVQLIAAHMPEMFGTHHTKMMILFRADGVAQVIIHTANLIPQDWMNLTQAVWKSPELPLLADDQQKEEDWRGYHPLGSGLRFKADLLKYLGSYEGRTKSLVVELKKYDFRSIKAALISSTPGKRPVEEVSTQVTTSFGWPGLKEVLTQIPSSSSATDEDEAIVNVQISSVATLTPDWIQNFLDVLKTRRSLNTSGRKKHKSKFNVIFPTAEEIRKSLDGYSSGDSIHMKLQSAAQEKQLQILKPLLHHWRSNLDDGKLEDMPRTKREALRNAAAPHIKTYIKFPDAKQRTVDWAMLTSANLSQQAWGWTADKNGQVRIASSEIGVVVWPGLFKEDDEMEVVMVPTFGRDMPEAGDVEAGVATTAAKTTIGVRMPYDLPLVPYGKADVPWCATMAHEEPDWMGNVWGGYEYRV